MRSKQEAISNNLNNYFNYQHIGLCIFTNNNFFQESQLSLGLKFLLNWENSFTENFDPNLEQTLYLSHLYDRTFPVIFTKAPIAQVNLVKHLANYAELISGLSTKKDGSAIDLMEPKLLLIVDQKIDSKTFDKISKDILSFTIPMGDKNLTCDQYLLDQNN